MVVHALILLPHPAGPQRRREHHTGLSSATTNFFGKRRFSGGDVCGVQPSECRVLAIQNGPTQLGDWALSYLSIREKFILRFMTGESWCAT